MDVFYNYTSILSELFCAPQLANFWYVNAAIPRRRRVPGYIDNRGNMRVKSIRAVIVVAGLNTFQRSRVGVGMN